METLSVVIATYNEEKNIEDCLKSLKGLADEIIVVDGGSTDNTVSIAKKYDVKIQITDNPPIFHINKQKAIELAKMKWILQLDADERLSDTLRDEVKQVLSSGSDINGFWLPRKNWFLGRFLKKGGQYPDYTLRLYRNGKGRLPQLSVHEQAVVEGTVGYLHEPLIHIADPSFSRYLLRFNRYTKLMADELKQEKVGKNPFVMIKYIVMMPTWWFFWTYMRHKGFMDSWQGFVFSFFSSLRFPVSYIKYMKNSL